MSQAPLPGVEKIEMAARVSSAPLALRFSALKGLANLRASWLLYLGLSLIALFGFMALLHPILMATVWPQRIYHPLVGFDPDLIPHPNGPSLRHLLGTDSMGRDVLSQLLYATRVSFSLGIVAGLVATALATIVGVVAAHFRGAVDMVLMGISDAFVLMPAPVVLLVLGLLVQMNWLQLALIYGLFSGLGSLAMITKSHAQSIRVKPFIEAAYVSGGSDWHIIRVHYLPNMLSVMLVNMMFTVTQSVLIEALLSFFGRTQLRISWGTMIWFTQSTFRISAHGEQWHAVLAPALAIMLFCCAFYMVGRSLDEVVNPRLRRR